MRYSMCRSDMSSRVDMEAYKEEVFNREIEKAMKEGQMYGLALKKRKRFRSAFTTEQVIYLEKEFRKYPYVGNARRKEVATVLNIPERAVKIWFQNRRMKEKKDTSNKESEIGKASGATNASVRTTQIAQSANDNTSLPRLTCKANQNIAGIKNNFLTKTKYDNHSFVLNNFVSKSDNATNAEVCNNSTVIIKPTSSTKDVASTSRCTTENEKDNDGTSIRAAQSTVDDFLRKNSPVDHVQFKTEAQNLRYSPYNLPSSIPEDLSSKAYTKSSPSRPSPEVKLNTEPPVYFKGFYAQPYLPPSSMIWKPVNVAPMVSTPISLVPNETTTQRVVRGNCSCDCHKPYNPPMLLQGSPDSNVQYVMAAVPFQNPSFKF